MRPAPCRPRRDGSPRTGSALRPCGSAGRGRPARRNPSGCSAGPRCVPAARRGVDGLADATSSIRIGSASRGGAWPSLSTRHISTIRSMWIRPCAALRSRGAAPCGSAAPPGGGVSAAGFGRAARKRASWVVTMFSISELRRASWRGMALIRIAWLGIRFPAPFSSASARLAGCSGAAPRSLQRCSRRQERQVVVRLVIPIDHSPIPPKRSCRSCLP